MDMHGFPVRLISEGIEWGDAAGWAQAALSFIAILAGFAGILYQAHRHRQGIGIAAAEIAKGALDRVTERLEPLVDGTGEPAVLMLRGNRAREMVSILREIDVSSLPPRLIGPIATIRSSVFSLNERVDEIFAVEGRAPAKRTERAERLKSAGRVLLAARSEFAHCFPKEKLKPLSSNLVGYLATIGEKPPLP